jgi:hypothetical protein
VAPSSQIGRALRRLLLAFVLAVATAFPASAVTGLGLLPQTAGQRMTYRLVRSVQLTNGTQSATTVTFSVMRRAGSTAVIERAGPDGTPNSSLVTLTADGTLVPADTRTTSADGDLAEVLYALNLANAATREGDPTASGTWLGVIQAVPAPRATTAPLVLVPSSITGTSFDFGGSVQSAVTVEGPARGPGPIAQTLHVDGHVTAGRVTRIAITQLRTLMVAGLPYANISSWTLTVGP